MRGKMARNPALYGESAEFAVYPTIWDVGCVKKAHVPHPSVEKEYLHHKCNGLHSICTNNRQS